MEITEVDIADSLKNLKAKDRIKTSHAFFLLFFLIIGFAAEFMYIKSLKRELDSLKTEVEKMREAAVNSTNSAIANTNGRVRDLKEKTSSVVERLNFLENEMNTTQKKVDSADHSISALITEMSQVSNNMNLRIESVETKYDLFNSSHYLTEFLKMAEIPKAVNALKDEIKVVHLKINTTGSTISFLIKNVSDVNAELKKVIEKNKNWKLDTRNSVVALNESILTTKAEIKDMQKEASLRWINETETIEALEHRVHHTETIMDYMNRELVNWKTMEYLELDNFTRGLESLNAEKPQHEADVRNTADKSTTITSHPIQKSVERSNTNNTSAVPQITESEPISHNDKVLKTDDGNSIRKKVNTNAISNSSLDNSNESIQRMPKSSSLNFSTQTLKNLSTSVKSPSKEMIESKPMF